MARYAPTPEQQAIIDAAVDMISGTSHDEGALKALAGAGSGKTSTLIQIGSAVKDRYPNAKILYLAYNREIKMEAASKFGSLAESFTIHGLAHQELGMKSVGRKLGNIHRGHVRDIVGKHLSDSDVELLQVALRAFTQSPDAWPSAKHFPTRVGGIPVPEQRRSSLVGGLEDLVTTLIPENKSGPLPLPHDLYLKYWQMIGSPGLDRYDLVMLDEAQDANPVILGALESAGRSIYVGDSHQAIYQWRNAVDALQKVFGRGFPMTQSFRFGPVIAEVANEILSYKHDKPSHPIRGFERLNSMIGVVDRNVQHARIYRTNRSLIREALVLHDRLIPFAIAGNNDEICTMIESLWELKNGNMRGVRHPLVRWLKTWQGATDAAEKGGDGRELNQAINIVDEFDQRVPEVLGIMKNSKDEARARVILTTAHRSKGREWENVVIAPDFDQVLDRAKGNRGMWDPEMNLLYVAATRAMGCLEVHCEWLRSLLNIPRGRY
ncbi:MAG: ATP-dependent helicase [Halomonadaceae bacterium]|nr:ATP-dependent helicase [Halomonadaceae bacterium]